MVRRREHRNPTQSRSARLDGAPEPPGRRRYTVPATYVGHQSVVGLETRGQRGSRLFLQKVQATQMGYYQSDLLVGDFGRACFFDGLEPLRSQALTSGFNH